MSGQRKEPAQVHCSECTRGGNGDKSCGAGWMVKDKRGANRYKMCFAGTRLPEDAPAAGTLAAVFAEGGL